jgi:hypothetical protein
MTEYERIREKITELVLRAWNNGILDYATRKSDKEKLAVLSFTSGKIEGDIPTITSQILSLDGIEIRAISQTPPDIRQSLEKYENDKVTLALETQMDMLKPDSEGNHFVKVIPKSCQRIKQEMPI